MIFGMTLQGQVSKVKLENGQGHPQGQSDLKQQWGQKLLFDLFFRGVDLYAVQTKSFSNILFVTYLHKCIYKECINTLILLSIVFEK